MSRVMRIIERVLAMLLCTGIAVGCGVVLTQCPFAQPKLPTLATVAIALGLVVSLVMLAILIVEMFRGGKN